MKTNKWIAGMMVCAGVALAACTSDDGLNVPVDAKEGKLTLNLSSGTNFSEETRAVNENSYKNTDNYIVKVFDKDNVEKLSCKGSEINGEMPLTLSIGSYTVKAYYGTEHDASRDEFYVEGIAAGTIKADHSEVASVVCKPTCGRIKVDFKSGMDTYFSDYKVEFKGTKALGTKTISWAKGDTAPWYVKLNEGGETITFTITTTPKEQYNASGPKTGTFTLLRNKAYKINVEPGYNPPGTGDVTISVTIDESTIDKPVDIVVPITWI